MAAVPSIGRAAGVEPKPAPEADATRDLYERYARQIFSYCLHQLSSREEAEDAVQTTFMNAFRGLKRGVVPEAEQAWLFKIAENVCLSRRRSSWRRGRVESPNDFEVLQEVVPSRSQTSNVELIGLEDALAAMPENQRRAILLREWQGLSYREIADELDLSQSAVETLIFRARRTLANGLEQAEPRKKRRLRAGEGLNLGSLLAGLKTLVSSGVAVKAVALAAVATVAAPQAAHVARVVERQVAPPKHHSAPAKPVSTRSTAPVAAATAGQAHTGKQPPVHALAKAAHAAPPQQTEEPTPPAEQPAAQEPVEQPAAAQPANGDDQGKGNAKQDEPQAASPVEPSAPANGNENGDKGKGDGNGKKADPAPTAAPTSNGNARKADPPAGDNTGDKGQGNGNGNGKKADPVPVVPASVTPLPPVATPPAVVDNDGKTNGNDKKAVDAPSVPVTNTPPVHGDGTGGKGKGK